MGRDTQPGTQRDTRDTPNTRNTRDTRDTQRDTQRFAAPLPADEDARQRAVDALRIVDTPREASFDDVVGLAAAICETPMAAFTVLTGERQWFKSEVGLNDTETHRDLAFCGYTILGDDALIVEDTHGDARFHDHPSVRTGKFIRFYVGMPIRAPDGHAVGSLCVMDDVPRRPSALALRALRVLADQIQTQLALRVSLHTQQVIAKRKDELTQFIVHDLKSPLSAIGPTAEFIATRTDGSAVAEAAQEIAHAAERMHRMVLDVLDISRSEGELPLVRTRLNVAQLVRAAAAQATARASSSRVTLSVDAATELIVDVDRELLLRVLDNLVDNAFKYGESRIVLSARRVEVSDGAFAELAVADDGMGIPAGEREHIFERGTRLAEHTQHASSSQGLGLSFCALAVRAHGGTIRVDDNVPRGSRFVIHLPL